MPEVAGQNYEVPPQNEERRFDPSHGNKIQFTIVIIKNHQVMEKTNIQRDIEAQEIKRIWQQLAIGTAIAIIGLVFMGIGELVCRWIERQ